MDVLVLGASSGIAKALLQELWLTRAVARERWVLTTRNGKELVELTHAAGPERLLTWHSIDAFQDPQLLLEKLHPLNWRPQLVLVAWGTLAKSGQPDAGESNMEWSINAVLTLRWLESIAHWMKQENASPNVAVLGSVAGDRPRLALWNYCISKQELERGVNKLRQQFPLIRWTLVKPGPVSTPMTAHLPNSPLMATPQDIAPRVCKAWLEGWPQVYAPAYWGVVSKLLRFIPDAIWMRRPFANH